MTYARARLWLGITSVGTLVVLSGVALALDLPGRTLPATGDPWMTELLWLALAFGVYAAVSAPFDLLGGLVLPREFDRSRLSTARFLGRWSRGVVVQGLWMTALGLAVLQVSRAGGPGAGFGLVVLASAFLIGAQGWFAGRVANLEAAAPGTAGLDDGLREVGLDPATVAVVDHDDPGWTGGWVGWPSRERLLLPRHWITTLSPDALRTELQRRRATKESGARARGVLTALAFNLSGFALAILLPGGSLTSVAGLATTALWFTLWSFLGALVLPSWSRPAVHAADLAALRAGADPGALERTIRELDRLQDDEPRRNPGVERIFHPIPAVEHRLARARPGQAAGPGAWHTARMALWLGWGCFGLLGRAVHCNCGRPGLWVLLPAD